VVDAETVAVVAGPVVTVVVETGRGRVGLGVTGAGTAGT
jgi:hypothetical protein